MLTGNCFSISVWVLQEHEMLLGMEAITVHICV